MPYYDDPEPQNDENTPLISSDTNGQKFVGLSPKTSYASGWAAFGVAWTVVSIQAFLRWFVSEDFHPAPLVDGPDTLARWRFVMLRLVEIISTAVLFGFFWYCVVVPLRTPQPGPDGIARRGLSLDGKFVLGGLAAWVSDGFLNSQQYIFAWNAHNVNMGVWTRFLPFHREGGPHGYAESLVWGPPMYVYFCAGVAIVSCKCLQPLRRRWPNISNMNLLIITWCGEFLFDFVVENSIICLSHAYAFPNTYAPLTLWAGETEQLPLYESICVATLGSFFTQMRLRSLDDPCGLSPVEHGFDAWPRPLQSPVRAFAVIGFCALSTICVYHLPINWLGIIGTSRGKLPSYMLPGSGIESMYPC
ncbi:hypothetical protein N7493_011445 [Penicillium malachiteum]|uniref:Uncharacterized protein n=1 Tax=Penicillium malachiteum TaxID=1324776 RepID=A0AAD6HCC7_9EURO|nr:hypothetical protein N7493_011445 [Penicillium malachiteum]